MNPSSQGFFSRVHSFYRLEKSLPLLAIPLAVFLGSHRASPEHLALDIFLTFLAVSFAYSINNLFDALEGEKNAAFPLARRKKLEALLLCIAPGILSIALALLLIDSGPRNALFSFLAIFFFYSTPFPRLRNIPGAEFLANVSAFFLLVVKSQLIQDPAGIGGRGFLTLSTFALSFFSISEAIHELAHEKEDRRLGRRTLFSFLGIEGAIALAGSLALLPLFLWTGPNSLVSIAFSLLRLGRILLSGRSPGEFENLRTRLFGREELLIHSAIFAFL